MDRDTASYQPPKLRAMAELREHARWANELIAEAKRNGQPTAWCTALSPNELLRGMGVLPVFPEAHAAGCGVKKAALPSCEAAEAAGFSAELCSYFKVDIAASLNDFSPIGQVPPPPEMLFCANNQCATVTKWYEISARIHQAPLFVLDAPFVVSPDPEPSVVAYVRRQLEELIAFVETHFGLRYDEAKLRETIRLSKRAVTLWQEILDLCRHRPSPVNTFDLWLQMTPMTLTRGTQQCVDYYELLKAEIEERVRAGVAAVPGERLRLLWDDIGIWQRMRELAEKFGSYGASFVASTYTDIWLFHELDPDNALDSLARACLGVHFNHSLDYRADYIIRRIKKYAVDGVVIHSCRSCKPWFIGSYDLKEMIAEQTGVPTLIFDGDQIDPRFLSDDQMYSRIDAFMETLTSKV